MNPGSFSIRHGLFLLARDAGKKIEKIGLIAPFEKNGADHIFGQDIKNDEKVRHASLTTKTCSAFYRIRVTASLAAIALFFSSQAHADLPPPIENPVLDEFGVEIKSGRYGDLSIPLISIGSGDAALTWIYAPQDGRYLFSRSIFNVHSRQEDFSATDLPDYYDTITFTYPGGVSKFRRKNASYPWQAEYNMGDTYDGATFTDKYGVKIVGGKLIYPDGREIWAGSTSWTFAPEPSNMPEMRNNFGFWLRTGGGFQAVNMAVDYCDLDVAVPCTGLSKTREASVNLTKSGSAWQSMTLRNAAGQVTTVTFTPFEAYDRPRCYFIGGGMQGYQQVCWGTKMTYYYPSTVKFPGSTTPDITLTYEGVGEPISISHNDIVVHSLIKNGVSVDYDNQVHPYATNQNALRGSQTKVISYVDGVQRGYAHSVMAAAIWPTGNLNLSYTRDALSQQTTYGTNNRGDITSINRPEGNGISLEMDSRYNITKVIERPKSGISAAQLVTEYVYEAACTSANRAYCNLPRTIIDPKGNRTEFTYNSRGQVLTRIDPAPTVGAPRPITRNQYTLRTAMILNASGGYVPAGSPISMLTRTSTCRSVENCQGTADEVITEYDYGPTSGPNNLLLRGVTVTAANSSGQMESRRTCYQYNYFGEKISETTPAAGLGVCS